MSGNDRGQVFTLEAITAAVLLLASLAFALQVAGVTPGTTTTSSQQVGSQQTGVASGMIDAAAANDSLEPTVRYWNASNESFYGAGTEGGYYVGSPPQTTFGAILRSTFDERDVAYNVNLVYVQKDGDLQRQRLVRQGVPGDNARTVARTVTLHDDDRLYGPDGPTNTTLAEVVANENKSFYAPDAVDGPLYNVVRVEVVVWRV